MSWETDVVRAVAWFALGAQLALVAMSVAAWRRAEAAHRRAEELVDAARMLLHGAKLGLAGELKPTR